MLNLQSKLYIYDDRNKYVQNNNGVVAAIIHQTDRDQQIQKSLFERYVYWTDTNNPMNEWEATESCSNFTIVKGEDLFKGVLDTLYAP